MDNELDIVELKNEVNKQLGDAETFKALLDTTFKGLDASLAKRAFLEARMRGFTLKDFLDRNIYALPFKNKRTNIMEYSLVNSIDYCRKIGQKSGVVGKTDPIWIENDRGEIETCSVTIKKMTSGYVGDYTATVYFKEFSTGYQQWASKPHVMIAKVAEMTALRAACPEELSQAYVEEEYQKEIVHENVVDITDYSEREAELREIKTLAKLSDFWKKTTPAEKIALKDAKNEMKAILDTEVKNTSVTETSHENN